MKKLYLLYFLALGFFLNTNAQTILSKNKDLTAKLDTFFNNFYKPDEPGCAVLIVQGDEVIYKKAFGMADMEYELPMKPDMVFDLGSIGKQITAVVIMQLVEQGKLALDDPLDKYIKDFPMQEYTITIENLLTHISVPITALLKTGQVVMGKMKKLENSKTLNA